MVAQSGAQAGAIAKIATTWGTAVAGGAGNKLAANVSITDNTETLSSIQIGSGNQMLDDVTRGAISPRISIQGDGTYGNVFPVLLAQFLGTAAAPSEQTASQGDYKHTITYNTTPNAKYVTVARETSSTTVEEVPTSVVESIGLRTTSIPGYLAYNAELVGDQIVLTSVTNTNATIQAATLSEAPATSLAAANYDDDFQILAQSGGALSTSDQLNITSWDLNLTRPVEAVGEIRNSAGLGVPSVSDLFSGTLTVQLKDNPDHTYWTAWAAETIYKAKFVITGALVTGTSLARSITVYLPGLKLVQKPDWQLGSPGRNPTTLNFTLVKASANPTGMSSTYPYFEIINTRATSLLA